MNNSSLDYSATEDAANTWSAAAGLAVALILAPIFFHAAEKIGTSMLVISIIIYSASVIALFLISTLYHAFPAGRGRTTLRLLDHCSIFLLIAGTYTPFALGPLSNHGGLSLFAVEWSLAVIGIIFKVVGQFRFRLVSNLIYLGMGWLGVFWAPALIFEITWPGFLWLLGGGVLYTVGVGFYAAKGRPFAHFIWHLFVFAGACCHAYAIWRYVLTLST